MLKAKIRRTSEWCSHCGHWNYTWQGQLYYILGQQAIVLFSVDADTWDAALRCVWDAILEELKKDEAERAFKLMQRMAADLQLYGLGV